MNEYYYYTDNYVCNHVDHSADDEDEDGDRNKKQQ